MFALAKYLFSLAEAKDKKKRGCKLLNRNHRDRIAENGANHLCRQPLSFNSSRMIAQLCAIVKVDNGILLIWPIQGFSVDDNLL
jgi:hypothetical protein